MLIMDAISKTWKKFKKDDLVKSSEVDILLLNILIELKLISELLKNNGEGQPTNSTMRQTIMDE